MFERLDGLRTIEFGTPGPSREKLVNLILHGQKRATAGLLISDYEDEGEPIEHVGELLAMVDNGGYHVGTIQVTRTEVMRFSDVPDELAVAEGEGDTNATDFRASHLAYWTRIGEKVNDDTLIVTVYFKLMPEIISGGRHHWFR